MEMKKGGSVSFPPGYLALVIEDPVRIFGVERRKIYGKKLDCKIHGMG